jgi:hypothetical protein
LYRKSFAVRLGTVFYESCRRLAHCERPGQASSLLDPPREAECEKSVHHVSYPIVRAGNALKSLGLTPSASVSPISGLNCRPHSRG